MSVLSTEALTRLAPWRDFPAPFHVAGGWAIDLFLGERTRPHEDVDIQIGRQDLPLFFHHFRGASVMGAQRGRLISLDDAQSAEPFHELHIDPEVTPLLEVLVAEVRGGDLIYRRDERVRMPLSDYARLAPGGIPYGAPAWELLFKSRASRQKDERDLLRVLPRLSARERWWFAGALSTTSPGHPWLTVIGKADPRGRWTKPQEGDGAGAANRPPSS